MSWFVFVSGGLSSLLIAVVLVAMPALVRRTVPLGVSVPRDRVEHPAVVSAVRRFRAGVVIALVISLAAGAVSVAADPVAGILVPTFAMLALSLAAYLVCRRGIQRAKAAEGWYEDASVRIVGSVTARTERVPNPVGWYLVSVAVLAVVAAVGVLAYPSFPDPMPTHWNAQGVADGFAAKSPWSVFGGVLIGIGMIALLYGASLSVRFMPVRRAASASPAADAARRHGLWRLLIGLFGRLTLTVTLLMAAITLFGWFFPASSWFPAVVTVLFLAATIAIILVLSIRYARQNRAADGTRRGDAEDPDDDRFWKAGILYVNRNDPAFLVPKRFGIGWTVNLGHPAGVVLLVLLAAGIAAAAILPGVLGSR